MCEELLPTLRKYPINQLQKGTRASLLKASTNSGWLASHWSLDMLNISHVPRTEMEPEKVS